MLPPLRQFNIKPQLLIPTDRWRLKAVSKQFHLDCHDVCETNTFDIWSAREAGVFRGDVEVPFGDVKPYETMRPGAAAVPIVEAAEDPAAVCADAAAGEEHGVKHVDDAGLVLDFDLPFAVEVCIEEAEDINLGDLHPEQFVVPLHLVALPLDVRKRLLRLVPLLLLQLQQALHHAELAVEGFA